MIREIGSRRSLKEDIPAHFEKVPLPEGLPEIRKRIARRTKVENPSFSSATGVRESDRDVVDGFEDVLPTDPLGAGFWYNSWATTTQLVFALSIFPNPNIQKIINQPHVLTSRDTIAALRQQQVLSGLKFMDLGCGRVPSFALAARALGATVYTADYGMLQGADEASLSSHIIVDFNDPNAPEKLMRATGGKFDLVTEHIVGGTLDSPDHLITPEPETILKISDGLLKKGGYLYYSKTGLVALRKKE